MKTLLVVLSLIFTGYVGAFMSWQIRHNNWSIGWSFISGFMSMFIWAYMTKYMDKNLVTTTLLFDVTYNVTWVFVLWRLGESLNPTQWVGAVLILAGIALLS